MINLAIRPTIHSFARTLSFVRVVLFEPSSTTSFPRSIPIPFDPIPYSSSFGFVQDPSP
jgi:hypothetical protein